MNNKKQVYSEFVVRPYENELYHYALKHANKDFKYIRKERKNGKWRYYYDDDSKGGGKTLKDIQPATARNMTQNPKSLKPLKGANQAIIKPDTQSGPTVIPKTKNSQATKDAKNAHVKPDQGNTPTSERTNLKNVAKDSKPAEMDPRMKNNLKYAKTLKDLKRASTMSPDADIEQKRNHVNYGVDHGPAAKFQSIDEMPKKTSEMSANEDQKAVNPEYDPREAAYSTNCAYCSATWDLRRRGYDVEAQASTSAYDTDLEEIASWYGAGLEAYSGVTVDLMDKYGVETCEYLVEELIQEEGEGSYGNFILYWNVGGAHSVVWSVENGNVMIRDTQLNTVDTFEDYMKQHREYIEEYYYLRTDNREITPAILEVARRREEKKNDR